MKQSTLLVCLGLLMLFAAGCSPLTLTLGGRDDSGLRPEVVSTDVGRSQGRVALIDVSGSLFNANNTGLFGSGENPVSLFSEQLDAAAKDRAVRAVVLRLNTPGGTVTASDAMYREVQRFKATTGKPVIALMMDVTASGGYYLACAADELIAYPTTVTGSVGVIMQTMSLQQTLSRLGVTTDAIVSGPNKDAGSPLATMTPDQRAIFQSIVDDFYERFVDVVRENRRAVSAEHLAVVTDGRIFTGSQAVALGMVDALGDIHDAIEAAKRAAGIERATIVRYRRATGYAGSVYGETPTRNGTQINLAQINIDTTADNGAAFYYIWNPTPLPSSR